MVTEVELKRRQLNATTALIVDADQIVRYKIVYPRCCGRNFYEVIRSLDSLQLSSLSAIGTPANWCAGDSVFLLPDVDTEEAELLFEGVVQHQDVGEGRPACRSITYPDVHTRRMPFFKR